MEADFGRGTNPSKNLNDPQLPSLTRIEQEADTAL